MDTFSPTCQAYFESNISAWAFCRQIGMKENRFHYTGRPKSARNRRKNSEILPVRINSQFMEGRPYRRTRYVRDEIGSSRLRNNLSQWRECPPVW